MQDEFTLSVCINRHFAVQGALGIIVPAGELRIMKRISGIAVIVECKRQKRHCAARLHFRFRICGDRHADRMVFFGKRKRAKEQDGYEQFPNNR